MLKPNECGLIIEKCLAGISGEILTIIIICISIINNEPLKLYEKGQKTKICFVFCHYFNRVYRISLFSYFSQKRLLKALIIVYR